jgi:molecular chaperone DnaK (HSP70)
MPYVLGIDIGGTTTTAAVSRLQESGWGAAEVARLGARTDWVPSALQVGPDGAVTVTDPGQLDADRVARGFCRRIGDDVAMIVGGEPCPPQALTAVLAMWVVERVQVQEGGPADHVVIGHPASWGSYRRALLHQALRDIGLTSVALLPEPVLAAESHAARGPVGDTLAVYALGGSDFEASVVRRSGPDTFRLLGAAAAADQYGGTDVDEALGNHVAAKLGRQFRELCKSGPQARLARFGLWRECVRAKERLTTATETEVLVPLPGGQVPVPITRAELAELIRPALQLTVEVLGRTVQACGLAASQLNGVLLVGGSAKLPLVSELVTTNLAAPVTLGPDPQTTVATGAAVVAAKIATPPQEVRQRAAPIRPAGPPPGSPGAAAPPDPQPARESGGQPPPRPPVKITPLKLSRTRSGPRRFGLVGGRS